MSFRGLSEYISKKYQASLQVEEYFCFVNSRVCARDDVSEILRYIIAQTALN